MAANLELIISATDKASGALSSIDKKAAGLGATMGKGLALAGVAAAAGLGVAVVAGVSFVKAAAEEEASIKRLATAIDANGGSWAKQGAAIEQTIRQREKLAFSDDELRNSLSLLTAQTGDVDEAIRRQGVAMDFSRGAGIDLATASKLLGKVTDENVNVLARYGIRAKEGMDATELLGLVQQKFAGQSGAFAETTAGKWQRFNNELDNLKETIGAALLPVLGTLAGFMADRLPGIIETVESGMRELGDYIDAHLKPIFEGIVNVFKEDLLPILEDVFGKIDGFVGKKAEIGAALGALAVLFGGLAIAAGAAAVSIGLAIWPLTAVVLAGGAAVGALIVLDEKTGLVTDAFNVFRQAIEDVWTWLDPHLREVVENTVQLWNTNLKPALDDLTKAFKEDLLPVLRDDVKPVLEDILGFLREHPEAIAIAVGAIGLLVAPWATVIATMLVVLATWDSLKVKFATIYNDIAGYINKIVDAYNSTIGKLPGQKDLPHQETINIGKMVGAEGEGMGQNIGQSPINQRALGGVTINFNSVVPADPATIQRSKLAIESILRS